jgi:hypothetical protein
MTDGENRSGVSSSRIGAVAWPLLVVLATAAYAVLPFLGSRTFYLRGDSGGQFIPTWFHLGEMVREGQWPPVLDVDTWIGGNYAAETLFGVYNPLNAANWVLVSLFDDLALASVVVKAEFLVLLALGCYLVAREYGSARWAAASAAVALPFAGFTLYWDTASWLSGLIAFTYLPYVWWSFRRTADRRLNPIWAFVIGALAVTQGNPYGVLGIVAVGAALLVENALRRRWTAIGRLVVVGVGVACVIPLVFWPLLETAPLTYRSEIPSVFNSNFMRPVPGELLALSSPTYLPDMLTFLDPMRVPALYLSWWVLPMLPWLRWSVLRGRLREISGVFALGGLYLMLTMAPSVLWMFRWPVRLVEYLWLPVLVLLAVVMSGGLRRDHLWFRAAASLLTVGLSIWISWAEHPEKWAHQLAALVLVAGLVAVLVGVLRLRGVARTVATGVLLVGGTGAVLGLQLQFYPENASAASWYFPTSVPELRERFEDRYPGTFMQFGHVPRGDGVQRDRVEAAWEDVLLASMYPVAGVDSVNTYTGMGYVDFTRTLQMTYSGRAQRPGYFALWQQESAGQPRLADLMKLDTVVVMRRLIDSPPVPSGWRVAERDPAVTVLRRDEPQPWPDGRLSWVSPGVVVASDLTHSPRSETIELEALPEGDAELVFARLAWPGYSATLDGTSLPVGATDEGLLKVNVPAGEQPGEIELRFTPPGWGLGLVAAGAGLSLTLALGVVDVVRSRRRRREDVAVRQEDRELAIR